MFDYKGSFQQESASNMSTMDLAACPHILHPYFHPRVDKKVMFGANEQSGGR